MQTWLSGVTALQAGVLIAHSPNATVFPQLPQLTAQFASAQRFRFADRLDLPVR